MPSNRLPLLTTAALILFGIGFFPAIQGLYHKWAASEEYAHAFIAVPILGFILWRKRGLLLGEGKGGSYLGLAALVLSIPLYLVALQLQVPTITSLTMVAVIVSALVYLGGLRIVKELATPLILLVLLIPIPNQIYSMLTLPLQLQVSRIVEAIAQFMGVPIFREGNILYTAEKAYQIIDACSGLRMIISLVSLSLIMAYFNLERNRTKAILVAASIPVAFGVNILRELALVLAYRYYRIDLGESTNHTMTGLAVFVVALIALYGVQKILEVWEKADQGST